MTQNKTTENDGSVAGFLDSIESETKRNDCIELDKIISKTTGEQAKMWGTAIVGYGSYHYKYESGREGDFMRSGFLLANRILPSILLMVLMITERI